MTSWPSDWLAPPVDRARNLQLKLRASLRRLITVALALLLPLIAFAALWFLPKALTPNEGLTVEARARLELEERRTAIAALVALGGAISLLYTHRRHDLDRDANRTGRFTSAVEQLGHDSSDVQLGGIYALGAHSTGFDAGSNRGF